MPRLLILALALTLAGCATTEPDVAPPPPPDPCPGAAGADLEPRIPTIALTAAEDTAIGRAMLSIIGADRFAARALAEARDNARTRRLETRITKTRDWCAGRVGSTVGAQP